MLPWLGSQLQSAWGPFRLLGSHGMLILVGLYGGFFLTFLVLPRLFRFLPHDRGKELSVGGAAAKGKPTGAGIVFVSAFALLSLLVVPFSAPVLAVMGLTWFMMLTGYLDDRSRGEWNEYLKGALDLALAAAASLVLCGGRDASLWLPFLAGTVSVPAWLFVIVSTVLIWVSVNSTNCSDGVDGLSGTLAMVALMSLGALLYFVLGNTNIAGYLLLPHLVDGARWAILVFTLTGCLAAYLWYNAYPSRVLMGDAGSRALGFFIGVMVMASGNPFLIFVSSTMLLVNGGTGLVKVALLRFLKIRIFHNTRFPLHDHVRQNHQWSNSQVLLKFAIIQVLITLGLFGVFLKVR
jgi:phospho-N-acetylmuramoyl-pentapeptide-transferase